MNELIIKLEEIESILLTFENLLSDDDKNDLKKEFNRILLSLRKPLVKNKFEYDTPQDIIDFMIVKCNIKEDFAINKSRKRDDYAYPRHIARTILRHVFKNETLNSIGCYFSNSDHATVLHSVKTVKNLCETDKEFKEMFNDIQIKILGDICIKF